MEEKEEEEESDSSVHGSENCLRKYLVVGVVFIEGERTFKHKCILERMVFAAIERMLAKRSRTAVLQSWWKGCVCGGRVRCVGVVKVCWTVLEMGR